MDGSDGGPVRLVIPSFVLMAVLAAVLGVAVLVLLPGMLPDAQHALLLGLFGALAGVAVLGALRARALLARWSTERERAARLAWEQAARAAAETLERKQAETLAIFDAFLAGAPVGVAFVDRELRYVRINAILAELQGRPADAHLGRRPSEALGAPGAALEALFQRVLDTGVPLLEWEVEVPDGDGAQRRVRHALLHYFPVRTAEDAPPLGVGAVVLDITDRKRTEEELRRSDRFRDELLGVVSHDLRNPLNALTLSARALLREPTLAPRERRQAERIAASGARMARMISELLDLTRSRLGGGIPVHPSPGDLFALCREAAEEAAVANRAEGRILLRTQGDGAGAWDASRMGQVVSNLVGNALRYSPPGSPVTVRMDGSGPGVVLEVHNAGEPIPPELLPRLFEPFHRGPSEAASGAAHDGLGLGLYIVQQIVRAHGGSVEVRSTSRDGTTFTVHLPRGAHRPPAAPGPAPTQA